MSPQIKPQSLQTSAIHLLQLLTNLSTLIPTLLLAGMALGVDRLSPSLQSIWPSFLVPRNTRISGDTAGKQRGDIAKLKGLQSVGAEEKRIRTFRSVFIANMIPIINELSYFLPPSQDFIPKISKFIISQSTKHEGWSVEAENISIPTLSTCPNQEESISKSDSNPRPSSKLTRVPTSSALPFSSKLSSKVLQGPLSPTSFNPNPNPSQTSPSLSATWLWSTRASEVKAGEVTAVKPVSNQGGLGAGKAFENEKVIMLLSSSPLVGTALGLTLSKTTGLRVLLVNTPINDQEKPFPFALHEALSAWAYLIDRLGFQPGNVTLAGDSIGAGLCLTLHLYLSCLLHLEEGQESLASLGRPTKLLLHSPRCDHTFQSPSFTINQDFDIINPQDCKDWSRNYLSSVSVSSPSNAQDFEKTTTGVESLKEIAGEVLNSVNVHGKYHPFFSLGLPSSENRYIRLACKLFGNVDGEQIDEKDKLKVLITVGTHEVVVGEGRVLAKNLTDVENVLVQYVEVQDEPYGFAWLLSTSSAKAVISKLTKQFVAEC